MEGISEYQLEKYQRNWNDIEEAQKTYEKVKQQNEDLLEKLMVLKILSKADLIRDKLFQFKVKLFHSTYQLYDIFPDVLPTEQLLLLTQCENCFYYLIEIFVSQAFHEKLVSQKWTFNISISNSQMRCNKSVSLKNRISNPITAVVPFSNKLENSLVEVYLVSFFEYNCSSIKLASIPIDASYRFEEHNPNHKKKTISFDISRIHAAYNPNIEAPIYEIGNCVSYKSFCNWSHEKLLEVILGNCYHRLDPFKIINKSEDLVSLVISVDDAKSTVVLNLEEKSLEIKSNIYGLQFLKTYFFKNNYPLSKKDFSQVLPLDDIKGIKDEISDEMEREFSSKEVLLSIYEKYLKFISHYPL